MKHSYPKNEKLKRKNTINLLFSEGKSIKKYPLRLVYVPLNNQKEPVQIGVSVSKRYFKNATDRNYFKRVLRECYRLNKNILHTGSEQSYAFMLLYQTRKKIAHQELNATTKFIFQKFVETEKLQSKITSNLS